MTARLDRPVSPADRAAFDRDGVVCLRNVLTDTEITHLRDAVDRQLAGLGQTRTGYDFEDLAGQIWNPARRMDTGAAERFDMEMMKDMILDDPEARPLRETDASDAAGVFFYDAAAWKADSGVRKVAFDSRLPEIAAELLDARYVNFWEDTTFVKGPHTRQKTAFHQDLAYFQISGTQCVVAWIALDPVTHDNGRMQYVRGSHRWGETYAPNVFISQTPFRSSPERKCADIEGALDAYDILAFDVMPGDVIIHNVMTLHGSGGNRSDRWRRAMSLRYCGDKVRYYDRPGAIPQVGVSHDLRDGDRLFSRDYPIVWPKPWPGLKLAEMYACPDPGVSSSEI